MPSQANGKTYGTKQTHTCIIRTDQLDMKREVAMLVNHVSIIENWGKLLVVRHRQIQSNVLILQYDANT